MGVLIERWSDMIGPFVVRYLSPSSHSSMTLRIQKGEVKVADGARCGLMGTVDWACRGDAP